MKKNTIRRMLFIGELMVLIILMLVALLRVEGIYWYIWPLYFIGVTLEIIGAEMDYRRRNKK